MPATTGQAPVFCILPVFIRSGIEQTYILRGWINPWGEGMPVFTVVHEYLKELRNEQNNEKRRKDLASRAIRNAYYRYMLDWDTIQKAGPRSHYDHYLAAVSDLYADLFIDVATEVVDVLPDQIEDLRTMATNLRRAASACSLSSSAGEEICKQASTFAEKKLDRL